MSVKEVTVAQAAEHLRKGTATLVDATDRDQRREFGVLPRAVLLSMYDQFDVKELPADKARPLIFYCVNRT